MDRELTGDFERGERRNLVLLAYVEALDAGAEPDRGQLLAEHPDLRQDLEAFLAGHDEVARLTAPLRAAGGGASAAPRHSVALMNRTEIPRGIGELGDFRLLREVGRRWDGVPSTRPSRSRFGGGSLAQGTALRRGH